MAHFKVKIQFLYNLFDDVESTINFVQIEISMYYLISVIREQLSIDYYLVVVAIKWFYHHLIDDHNR